VESLKNLFKNKYRTSSLRLECWDYSTPWWYYVTISTKNHINYFAYQNQSSLFLNNLGKQAKSFWLEIPHHYNFVELDYYVIMPNHIHGIIIMNYQNVETGHAPSLQCKPNTLGNIVGSFKSVVSRWAHKNGIPEFRWQTRFYERIIRNDTELYRIRKYIDQNPLKCDLEKELPENLDI